MSAIMSKFTHYRNIIYAFYSSNSYILFRSKYLIDKFLSLKEYL